MHFWILSALSFLMVATIGPTDQEVYYWSWSLQPGWSFFDHPPLLSWLHFVIRQISEAPWAIRLPSLLAKVLGFVVLVNSIRSVWGERCAVLTGWILLSSIFFFAFTLIALPDSILFLWATLVFRYSAVKPHMIKLGLCLGLAGLSKWTAVYLVPGVVFQIISLHRITSPQRHWNWAGIAKDLAVVGGVSLLIQWPVLYWNWIHDFASFRFHFQNRFPGGGAAWSWSKLRDFWGAQILMGLFGLWIACVYAIRKFRGHQSKCNGWNPPALWPWILPFFVGFSWTALKGDFRFYWAMLGFVFLSIWIAQQLSFAPAYKIRTIVRRFQQVAWTMLVIFVIILHCPVGAWLKPVTDLWKPYDMRHSVLGDYSGWDEWAEHIRPKLLPGTVIMGVDFRISAQAAYALEQRDTHYIKALPWLLGQYQFWDGPPKEQVMAFLMVSDNRRRFFIDMSRFCTHPIEKKFFKVYRQGHAIKEIEWIYCTEVKWDKETEKNFRLSSHSLSL